MTDTTDLRATFYNDCKANLDRSYELVHVDYRDGLTDEQVDALAGKDWEALDESLEEWLDETRYEGADYHRKEVMEQTEREWTEVHGYEIAEAVREAFESTDFYDELRFAIEDRDTSNPIRDLAGSTGMVLMRHLFGDIDHDAGLGEVLDILGLENTEANIKAVQDTLAEVVHPGFCANVQVVYAVSPSDLYDTMNDDFVEIVNPFLYIGNPYMGDGYCEHQLEGVLRLKRDELTTDKGAFGYGWDEVAGVYASAYEVEIRRVPNQPDPLEQIA
jgi:hypothetical protein